MNSYLFPLVPGEKRLMRIDDLQKCMEVRNRNCYDVRDANENKTLNFSLDKRWPKWCERRWVCE